MAACSSHSVYLDYNATTPVDPTVLEVISNSFTDHWGNPSSSYPAGKAAREAINNARRQVSVMIGASSPEDIVFTSGGTESNNLVLNSVIKRCTVELPHVITTCIEHDSVLLVLREMLKEERIELTELSPEASTGAISVEAVKNAIKDSTVLVSVMLANNETGVIQPVADVRRLLVELDRPRILLHTDAAQAIGKIPVSVSELGVDYLTVVGHKFYGPRIGAVYVKGLEGKRACEGDTPLYPMFYGGGQERGYRPGTENTAMIVGLGQASQLVIDNLVTLYQVKMAETRNYLEKRLKESFSSLVIFNNHFPSSTVNDRLPNTCNISIKGGACFHGNRVLRKLKHCQASVGAACHSNITNRPSPILIASGVDSDIALNAMRISIGRETSNGDIDVFIDDLKQALDSLTDSNID